MKDFFNDNILPLGTALFFLFFGSEPLIIKTVKALILLQVFDFGSAIFKNIIKGVKFDYRIFFKGIVKKLSMLMFVSFGYLVDTFDLISVSAVHFEISIASAFVVVEILSILNNFKQLGFNISIFEKYIKLD